MPLMRTRSRRFFVVLLHLVGCQQYYSPTTTGIVGVQPWPIVLESIHLEQLSLEVASDEPVWLQDPIDETCLGPTAQFTECGDATLWFVVPSKRKWLKSGIFGIDEEGLRQREEGFIFQVVDRDYYESSSSSKDDESSSAWWKRNKRRPKMECLEALGDSVQVQGCHKRSKEIAKAWKVDQNGYLRILRRPTKNDNNNAPASCMYRDATNKATLAECHADDNSEHRQVQLSLVRYRAVTVPAANVANLQEAQTATRQAPEISKSTRRSSRTERTTESEEKETLEIANLPSKRGDIAHSHAIEPCQHPDLKLGQGPALKPKRSGPTPLAATLRNTNPILLMPADQQTSGTPFAALKDSNPILLVEQKKEGPRTETTPFSALSNTNPILLMNGTNQKRQQGKKKKTTKLAHPPVGMSDLASYRVRPIQVHPYIAEAKNEIWTDPQTGLSYPTDLCHYLGHDRKERGRHTLTGVGQYRKGFVIKVYGIAHYVSKRDVLADPFFETYASLNTEELRGRPDFYNYLRQKPDASSGLFDRTLMIKTNMQLAAETIRSSLQADWSYLTEEAKVTLIGSSLHARPANADMLKLIQSADNPSRCSCSQVAPDEYDADPSCCARGTELAFTWLKNGDLEVRLNGRMMERFARPDIAEGIFYEYLRYDDPISPDLRERVVDGFPFLLAPLAQLKGVSIGQPKESKPAEPHGIFKAMSGMAEAASSYAAGVGGMIQHGASEMAGHAMSAAKLAGEAAHNFGKEADRRRDLLFKRAASMPETIMGMVSKQDPNQTVAEWVAANMTPSPDEEKPARRLSQGRVFGYPLSRWFGEVYYAPDEIGPMKIHPTMNMPRKIFLALVHLYLLLLFIVSLPGSYSTRTKLVVRKNCVSRDISDSSDSDSSEDEKNRSLDEIPDIARSSKERLQCQERTYSRGSFLARARDALRPPSADERPEEASQMKKKSLSYFL